MLARFKSMRRLASSLRRRSREDGCRARLPLADQSAASFEQPFGVRVAGNARNTHHEELRQAARYCNPSLKIRWITTS